MGTSSHPQMWVVQNWCWGVVVEGDLEVTTYLGLAQLESIYLRCKDSTKGALAGVAQWIKCRPVNHRVAGLIPSQGTCLDCRPGPQ